MHLSEGILSPPVVIGTLALAGIAVACTVRRLDERNIPLAAMLGCVFFAIGTIHIPVGPGSVHLLMNGLLGTLLGWAALPVILVALILQAALFGFGGFAVLGANLLIMGLPAVAAYYATARLAGSRPATAGALAAVIGVTGAAAIASLLLFLSGGHVFMTAISAILLFHIPIAIVDAILSALCLGGLARLRPALLHDLHHTLHRTWRR